MKRLNKTLAGLLAAATSVTMLGGLQRPERRFGFGRNRRRRFRQRAAGGHVRRLRPV